MQLNSLRRLLLDELQEVYISEELVAEALPRLVAGVDAPDLRKALLEHGELTKAQLKRLDRVFEQLESSPRGGHGHAVKAMIAEAENRLGEPGDPHVMDAAVIAATKRLEHWEIACYGITAVYAEALKLTEIAGLLRQTLEEEQGMDAKLEKIAHEVNIEKPDPAEMQGPK